MTALEPRSALPPSSPAPGSARARAALIVALAADAIQIVLLPVFSPGALSPAADVIDVIVGIVMVRLLGWHVAFLPSFIAELIPFVDLFPSWTLAVLFVGRAKRHIRS